MSDKRQKKYSAKKARPATNNSGSSSGNNIESRQGTAKKAIDILIKSQKGYKKLTKNGRKNLLIAFANNNKVLYGKAFDIVKIKGSSEVDLENLESVKKHFNKIIIYEIKSTKKKDISDKFEKYFFSLSTAELLIAQNLRERFKFIFVNTNTKKIKELTLKQVFKRAKNIYPVWSIQF